MQKLSGQMRAAIDRYSLIQAGDKIAVGVSGGKDSLVLLYGLAKLQAYYPNSFSLIAITADPCFNGKETDFSQVEKLCCELKVPYVLKRTRLGSIIFDERKETNPCSLCARMRRGILHDMAKENGCSKLALGHHFDDAVETFFMNLFYGGNLGCFSPKSYLSRKNLTLIRPMVFCEEKDIKRIASRLDLPIVKSACPADGNTSRKSTQNLIYSLEKDFPQLRQKVVGAMQRASLDGWGIEK